jgi:hypothetical protein
MANWRIRIDVSELKDHIKKAEQSIEEGAQRVGLSETRLRKWRNQLRTLLQEIELSEKEMRRSRDVASWAMGLLGLGSIYSIYEVNALGEKLAEDEAEMMAASHQATLRLENVTRAVETLQHWAQEEIDTRMRAQFTAAATETLWRLEKEVGQKLRAVEDLKDGRLSRRVWRMTDIGKKFATIEKQAREKGWSIWDGSMNKLWVTRDPEHSWTVTIHIPMVKEENKFELQEWVPTPWQWDAEHAVWPEPETKWLAIRGNLSVQVTEEVLRKCWMKDTTRLCRGPRVWATGDSCIAALREGKTATIRQKCEMKARRMEHQAIEVGANKVIIVTPEETDVSWECQGRKWTETITEKLRLVEMPRNCGATTKYWRIMPDPLLEGVDDVVSLNVSTEFIFPQMGKDFRLALRDSQVSMGKLRELRFAERKTRFSWILGVLGLLVIAVIVGWAVLWIRRGPKGPEQTMVREQNRGRIFVKSVGTSAPSFVPQSQLE